MFTPDDQLDGKRVYAILHDWSNKGISDIREFSDSGYARLIKCEGHWNLDFEVSDHVRVFPLKQRSVEIYAADTEDPTLLMHYSEMERLK